MKNLKVLIAIMASLILISCGKKKPEEVVIYTSVDQIFSEPVLNRFEKETGIKVKPLYDVEASKTVGLVNRLIAEKGAPKCDVFWNSEVSRTIQLKNKSILQQYKSEHWEVFPETFKDSEQFWTGFGARSRVLIYNKDLISEEELPTSIFQFTEPEWKGKFTIAYPLFGTTATHVAALYSLIGAEKTEAYLKALVANEVVVVDGNGKTRDMVVEGKIPLGLTDTDDANVSIQQGKPVNTIYFDKEGIGTLLIPNTVALINSAPNSENGKMLIDFLLSEEIESMLAFGESAQMPLRSGVKKPDYIPDISDIKAMNVDYEDVANYIDQAAKFCQELFVR
jgi:iron(III) transport system substrate-binding protein